MNESTGPLISIVILNYNAEKFLDECLSSIYKTEKVNFEIILVDNASTDKSYREYTQKFPEIKLIENEKNLGYCEGNNVGIRASKGEFVVVLNPDTVVTPIWLHELINAYQANGEGIYQPKILATTDHDMLLSSGQFIQLFGFGYSRGKGEKHVQKSNTVEKISYAFGIGIPFPAALFPVNGSDTCCRCFKFFVHKEQSFFIHPSFPVILSAYFMPTFTASS